MKCSQRHSYNYHEYISSDWQDVLDGTDGWEYKTTLYDGTVVKVAAVGGGTIGRKYSGAWYYSVKVPGSPAVHGDDFVTNTEHTHKWAALAVAGLLTD